MSGSPEPATVLSYRKSLSNDGGSSSKERSVTEKVDNQNRKSRREALKQFYHLRKQQEANSKNGSISESALDSGFISNSIKNNNTGDSEINRLSSLNVGQVDRKDFAKDNKQSNTNNSSANNNTIDNKNLTKEVNEILKSADLKDLVALENKVHYEINSNKSLIKNIIYNNYFELIKINGYLSEMVLKNGQQQKGKKSANINNSSNGNSVISLLRDSDLEGSGNDNEDDDDDDDDLVVTDTIADANLSTSTTTSPADNALQNISTNNIANLNSKDREREWKQLGLIMSQKSDQNAAKMHVLDSVAGLQHRLKKIESMSSQVGSLNFVKQ